MSAPQLLPFGISFHRVAGLKIKAPDRFISEGKPMWAQNIVILGPNGTSSTVSVIFDEAMAEKLEATHQLMQLQPVSSNPDQVQP